MLRERRVGDIAQRILEQAEFLPHVVDGWHVARGRQRRHHLHWVAIPRDHHDFILRLSRIVSGDRFGERFGDFWLDGAEDRHLHAILSLNSGDAQREQQNEQNEYRTTYIIGHQIAFQKILVRCKT